MELREGLRPPVVPDERVAEIAAEIERISGLILRGDDPDPAIAAFNETTGHAYGVADFAEYQGWRSLEEFAVEAARPAHPRVDGVTRDELAEVVRRILDGGPETDWYVRVLEANVSRPGASGLIFHPPAELEGASAEEIVDVLLAHRPIAL